MYAEGIPVYSPLRVVDDDMKEKETARAVASKGRLHSIGSCVSHDWREAVRLV